MPRPLNHVQIQSRTLAVVIALLAVLALHARPANADALQVHVQTYVITHAQPSADADVAGTLMPGQAYIVSDVRVVEAVTWYALLTPDGASWGWAKATEVEASVPDGGGTPTTLMPAGIVFGSPVPTVTMPAPTMTMPSPTMTMPGPVMQPHPMMGTMP